jgi:hypothetical protein
VDAEVTPGGSAKFSCRAGGKDTPTITWHKDGRKVDVDDRRLSVASSGDASALTITLATEEDAGAYVCVVTAEGGGRKISREARLRYYQGRSKPIITHRYGSIFLGENRYSICSQACSY